MTSSQSPRRPRLLARQFAELLANPDAVLVADERGQLEVLPDGLIGDLADDAACVPLAFHEDAELFVALELEADASAGDRRTRVRLLAAARDGLTAELLDEHERVSFALALAP